MTTTNTFVLLKEDEENANASVLGVYCSEDLLWDRLNKIRAANSQYPLEQIGPHYWRIGPQEDEGFFGNRPVYLRAVETKLYE